MKQHSDLGCQWLNALCHHTGTLFLLFLRVTHREDREIEKGLLSTGLLPSWLVVSKAKAKSLELSPGVNSNHEPGILAHNATPRAGVSRKVE